jgi:hypothetical protein
MFLYVLNDTHNEWMFDTKAVKINKSLWLLALVQECQSDHNATLIEKILTNTNGISPTTMNLNNYINESWEVVKSNISKDKDVIILGLIHKDGVVDIFPDAAYCINDGDMLSLITNNTKEIELWI